MSGPRQRIGAWLGAALPVFVAGVIVGRRLWGRVFTRYQEWSIAIYRGTSPTSLMPVDGRGSALAARDVTDVPAVFVADPFLLRDNGSWEMFFEVLSARDGKGVIGHASSLDGEAWRYDRVVLDEPFHLSYPFVFEYDGDHYMAPETLEAGRVLLYRATAFPRRWERWMTLLEVPRNDPTIFRHEGRWWLFVGVGRENLELYWADELHGPWQPHPGNPVVFADPHHARPAGRVVEVEGQLVRLAQDGSPHYGLAVHAFRIEVLTTAHYAEVPFGDGPLLAAGQGRWNEGGMHHCDAIELGPSDWLAAVDGQRRSLAVRPPLTAGAWRWWGRAAPRVFERYLRGG